MSLIQSVLVLILGAALTWAAEDPLNYIELDIPGLGGVRGVRQAVLGTEVDVFRGIPFAEPPIGQLRFQRPVQHGPWEGTLDATQKPASCYQAVDSSFDSFLGVKQWNPNTNMSEDCLYLNVWTPKDALTRPRAVMVWIYGGGFYGGTSTLDLYDAAIFAATQDIVVVSMQYRTGTIGFFYMGSADAPGNMGLVDQNLALQWVYNHIDTFGGDNSRVTLFGESAGSVSVSMHMVSQLSWKLFNNAIMQSGSALCRWATESSASAKERSLKIAQMSEFNCSAADGSTPDNEVIACMRKQDANLMVNLMWNIQDEFNMITPILVTIDGYFFKEDPRVSVEAGRIKNNPVLLGANKDEGSFFLVYGLPPLFYMPRNVSLGDEVYRHLLTLISKSHDPLIHDLVNFEYNVPQDLENRQVPRDILDDMLGDAGFLCPTVRFGHSVALQGQNVYMYHFLHRTSGNTWPEWMGVMHGYEIDHIFGLPLNESYTYSAEEKVLSREMMQYWSNFARYSNPNGDVSNGAWQPYTVTDKEYMTIAAGTKEVRYGLRHRACTFWAEILPALKKSLSSEHNGRPEEAAVCCSLRNSAYTCTLLLMLAVCQLLSSKFV